MPLVPSEPPQMVPMTSSVNAISVRACCARLCCSLATASTPRAIVLRVPPCSWMTRVSTGLPLPRIASASSSRLNPSHPNDNNTAPPTLGCVHTARMILYA